MTMVFSHPNVKSFLMWGFWEGRHWKPDAAMYHLDWSPKPNLFEYKRLVFDEWWTKDTAMNTNMNGKTTGSGFLGKYEIKSTYNNESLVDTVWITDTSQINGFELKYNEMTGMKKLNNNSNFSLKVFPNPINGKKLNIHFQSTLNDKITIELFDIAGRKLFTKNIIPPAKKYAIDMHQFQNNSIFILKIASNNFVSIHKICSK
jgi:hypothetical protein